MYGIIKRVELLHVLRGIHFLGGYRIDSHWSRCRIDHNEMCGVGSESKNYL